MTEDKMIEYMFSREYIDEIHTEPEALYNCACNMVSRLQDNKQMINRLEEALGIEKQEFKKLEESKELQITIINGLGAENRELKNRLADTLEDNSALRKDLAHTLNEAGRYKQQRDRARKDLELAVERIERHVRQYEDLKNANETTDRMQTKTQVERLKQERDTVSARHNAVLEERDSWRKSALDTGETLVLIQRRIERLEDRIDQKR